MIIKTYKIIETNEIIDLEHNSLNDPNWEYVVKNGNDYVGLLHNQEDAKRVIRIYTSTPILFKGSGFYCTDYKNNNKSEISNDIQNEKID